MTGTIRPGLTGRLRRLAVIAMITGEPKGRHQLRPATPLTRPEGTASAAPDPASEAVPPHPWLGPLSRTPPGGITALVGEHGIRVGGDRPAWVTYIPGEHPYPETWDTSIDSTRRLYDALRREVQS